MSNIGSIHFVSQNQNFPAVEHAQRIAKELHEPEQLVPTPDAPRVEESESSARANEEFDGEQKERQSEGQKRRQGRLAQNGAQNEDGDEGDDAGNDDGADDYDDYDDADTYELQAAFFGEQISARAHTTSAQNNSSATSGYFESAAEDEFAGHKRLDFSV